MSKIVCPFVVSGTTIYFVFYLSYNYCRVALSLCRFSTGIEETAIYLSAICHNLPRHSYLPFAYALYI